MNLVINPLWTGCTFLSLGSHMWHTHHCPWMEEKLWVCSSSSLTQKYAGDYWSAFASVWLVHTAIFFFSTAPFLQPQLHISTFSASWSAPCSASCFASYSSSFFHTSELGLVFLLSQSCKNVWAIDSSHRHRLWSCTQECMLVHMKDLSYLWDASLNCPVLRFTKYSIRNLKLHLFIYLFLFVWLSKSDRCFVEKDLKKFILVLP